MLEAIFMGALNQIGQFHYGEITLPLKIRPLFSDKLDFLSYNNLKSYRLKFIDAVFFDLINIFVFQQIVIA